MTEWEKAATRLAQRHYLFEPAITEIRTISSPVPCGPNEPIKLLEVNANTVPSGIMPLRFDAVPASGIPFASVIVEVTPEEFEQIKRDELKLPNGWTLGPMVAKPDAGRNGRVSPSPDDWGKAYAKQALADFNIWDELQGNSVVPSCQKLHFLQMACEKLCKAHLCKQPGADPEDYQSSHAYTAKNLGIIILQQLSLTPNPPKNGKFLLSYCKGLAREIELLHPSVDGGGKRPDNCEYPWEQGGAVYVPAEWKFPALNLVEQQGGVSLLKLIQLAIRRLAI